MNRSELKDAHEESVLESFKNRAASLNKIIEIISKPEPPDAIVTINGDKTWIEITDAFFNNELAESITTHAADDKLHKPVLREKRSAIDPDEQFSNVLKSVILKKYEKNSIGNVYKKYGSGILLVGIVNPFSTAKELVASEKETIIEAIKLKEQRFNEIYLYDVNGYTFYKLL